MMMMDKLERRASRLRKVFWGGLGAAVYAAYLFGSDPSIGVGIVFVVASGLSIGTAYFLGRLSRQVLALQSWSWQQ
jgi:hypothetical protein